MHVTVWNEYVHEQQEERPRELYPDGMHATISADLREHGYDVTTATLDEPEHGLTEEMLEETDVLVWWGHRKHDAVSDDVVERVKSHILDGMGFIPLHSSHESKIFKALMGTTCELSWREADERERIWILEPGHQIAEGLDQQIVLEETEMYGERFDIPEPDTLVMVSWFEGGEVFRSGCCYRRGSGKIFYFRPGHETCPIFHNDEVMRVIRNAIDWAAPVDGPDVQFEAVEPPLESLDE
ncbi:ThuA domain-containing protein [Haloarcula amylovorans]|uniref:ThuA domain-containing protein n=1 Tax=Haloarcula amylovorans TaxID=2562280 RepID=UPI00107633FA|nr:ThuA domain-containing protein [Halomicroarcula amylolytica]